VEGNPAPEAFPSETLREIASALWQKDPLAAQLYGPCEGLPELRRDLREYLRRDYGLHREDDDLIIVSGAQQGIELACSVLANAGDTVLCEAPTYADVLHTFALHGLKVVAVEVEEDGISLEGLAKALKEHEVRFLYLIPTFQNPTSHTMSLAKRKAVYDLVREHDTIIVEDDPYSALRFRGESLPSLKALDEDGRVLYIGTFSKILSPGFRVGYVCGDSYLLERMALAKLYNDVHSSVPAQIIAHSFLTAPGFQAHLEFARCIYRQKCDLMLETMDRLLAGRLAYTRPEGGFFIWCELPAGSDLPELTKALARANLAIAPGNVFSLDPAAPQRTFRLSFSRPSAAQIVRGIEILAEVMTTLGM